MLWRYLVVRIFMQGPGPGQEPELGIPVEGKILLVAGAVVSMVGLAVFGFSWV